EERGLALPLAGLVGRYDRLKKDLQLKIPDSLSQLRFGKDVEIALFRICQEALNNAIRHSQSDAIRVELARREDQLVLSVSDNGSGLPDHAVEGLGLKTMRNRAEAVGGKLELNSGPTGTVVTVSLPFRPVN
ncbi:MAG: sensor histidine kinase, partial [Planctomycetota bacterium]